MDGQDVQDKDETRKKGLILFQAVEKHHKAKD
jgi:hypothetical protein